MGRLGKLIAVAASVAIIAVAMGLEPKRPTAPGAVAPAPVPATEPALVPTAEPAPAPTAAPPAPDAPKGDAPSNPADAVDAPPPDLAQALAPGQITGAAGKGSVTGMAIPRYVSLKGSEGNARRGPGFTHRIDWVFRKSGMPLRITAEYEHWRRVEDSEGEGGWIHYSLLSGVRSALVTQDMAEFHSDPDDRADLVFRAQKNVTGWLEKCLPDWCRLSVDGMTGWVRKTALWGVDRDEVFK